MSCNGGINPLHYRANLLAMSVLVEAGEVPL